MNLDYSPADDAFRADVRAWLEASLPRALRDKVFHHKRLSREDFASWHRLLGARMVGAWPKEYGGPGWGATAYLGRGVRPRRRADGAALRRIDGRARADRNTARRRKSPISCRASSMAPTGGVRATPNPAPVPISSRCARAERHGDHYIVNGQKTWTTLGQHADMIFCLVRTDMQAKKQEGISFLLIDMNTPGVTVRPIITLDEDHEVNEVFFR